MCNSRYRGTLPGVQVDPGVQTNSAVNNSSADSTYIKDSINTIVHVSITSGTLLLIGFLILLIAVICIHRLLKSHHRVHSKRIHTLASLVGFGSDDIKEDKEEEHNTKTSGV